MFRQILNLAGRLTNERERKECDFHRTLNYLEIWIVNNRIKREVPVTKRSYLASLKKNEFPTQLPVRDLHFCKNV